jgi:aspartyl-tRNA(Asn)/glutamyl-tRNA(Gln) amidotransferase subunit A
MTLRQKIKDVKSGSISVRQSLEKRLKIADETKHLNAYVQVLNERALRKAQDLDERIQKGAETGALAGTVIAIKDNINIQGENSTCASNILQNFKSPFNATVIDKLEKADAVIIGKTNLDEFAMGSSTENSAFGTVKNPFDETRVPGGSSGGSAVAVAAGSADVALGSDTGGSVRQPASFTATVGLKPTYGRISRFGLIAYASSLDQIGLFSSSVEDTAVLLKELAGKDNNDSTTADEPVPDYSASLDKDVNGMTIGVPEEYFADGLDPLIKETILEKIDALGKSGAKIEKINLPRTEYGIAAYYIVATAEASSNLARYDGVRFGLRKGGEDGLIDMYEKTRSAGFGAEVRRRIMLGTYVLSSGYYDAYYRRALKVRRLIKEDFDKAFAKVDVIITPTTPTTAFKIGEKVNDPLTMYLNDIYTVTINLAGICGMSIPAGKDDSGLPFGMQLLGNFFEESKIIRVGDFIEKNC